MHVQQLPNGARLRPQKPSRADTPHVTIETNTTCNIRCATCYAIEEPVVKSLDQVLVEIDYAIERRHLDTVSLLGGEPTLHPDLPEIVRYVKARGLVCEVLTNGVLYLVDGDRGVFERLAQAGVDRILVHVDSGQRHVHGDIAAARHRIYDLLEELQVWFGLSMTLYPGEENHLPALLRDGARYRWFDGALVTLALDFDQAFLEPHAQRHEPDLAQVAQAMHDQLGVDPSAYLPTNVDDDEIAWLMWFYWLDASTGRAQGLSPELNRAMKALYRRTHGHEFFGAPLDHETLGRTFLASIVADAALHPLHLAEATRLLRSLEDRRDLRLHYLVVQQAPWRDPATGQVHFCWQCPDATVRHQRLVPVCMAGRLSPLGDRPPSAPEEVIAQVYAHLGEPRPDPT